jgi:hypothetical protein
MAQVFPIHAERVETAVAVIAEVEPFASGGSLLAPSTRGAWFANVSTAVVRFERQGKESRAFVAGTFALPFALGGYSGCSGFGCTPSFCRFRFAS